MANGDEEFLTRMGAAEGSAALLGFARLCRALIERGVIDETTVGYIRDDMARSLDPTHRSEDAGLEQAYQNLVNQFDFLSKPAPPKGQFS